ncbi:aquaporin [Sandarakinorhabdus glacialis]|uniref:aquaporin n=1 Tax=Sandarakinorhabdus glacialis TaxID=1614636 RepID=UPI00166767F6
MLLAALIGLYIAVEGPLSGISLNPARSFGAALLAGQWNGMRLYFVAPPLAMLLATEVDRRARPERSPACRIIPCLWRRHDDR